MSFLSRLLPGATIFACGFLICAGTIDAAPKPAGVFGDHMVVQRGIPVPVWGTAAASESVTVKLGSATAGARAGADGKWMARLPPQPAGGPYELALQGATALSFKDVYVGEVWLASGQSNMDFRVHCTFSNCKLANEESETAAADYPLIRTCNVPYAPAAKPAADMKTTWMACTPKTVGDFSAAAYFFARRLSQALPGIAIGMVHASYGSSTLQCWISRDALMAMPGIADSVTGFERNSPDYTDQHNPYICYNGQINPLIPFAIKGVIWAQGESVTWGTGTYRALQVAEIESWRKAWGRDFTFLVTQLSRYGVSSGSWPTLREAQWQATRMVPDAGLAVTIDIGDSANVHYADKQDMGARLGLAALGVAYGLPIDFSGPAYDRMAIEGSSLRVYFLNAGKGLSFPDGKSAGFEVSPDGKTWTPATARIDRDTTVLLSASAVTAPKYARYAWAGWPQAGLFSRTDPALPAIPFRTNAPELPVGVARGSSSKIKPGARRAGGAYSRGRWEISIPGGKGKTADAHGHILVPNR